VACTDDLIQSDINKWLNLEMDPDWVAAEEFDFTNNAQACFDISAYDSSCCDSSFRMEGESSFLDSDCDILSSTFQVDTPCDSIVSSSPNPELDRDNRLNLFILCNAYCNNAQASDQVLKFLSSQIVSHLSPEFI